MDVFAFREELVSEYERFSRSFTTIPEDGTVTQALAEHLAKTLNDRMLLCNEKTFQELIRRYEHV